MLVSGRHDDVEDGYASEWSTPSALKYMPLAPNHTTVPPTWPEPGKGTGFAYAPIELACDDG